MQRLTIVAGKTEKDILLRTYKHNTEYYVLNCILKKYDVGLWTCFMRLRLGFNVWALVKTVMNCGMSNPVALRNNHIKL
jgi:hypothetical protein